MKMIGRKMTDLIGRSRRLALGQGLLARGGLNLTGNAAQVGAQAIVAM